MLCKSASGPWKTPLFFHVFQLLNQESVTSMLRMAGQELAAIMCERLAQCEEAAYSRRTEMEEERIHYLATEDRILSQLR